MLVLLAECVMSNTNTIALAELSTAYPHGLSNGSEPPPNPPPDLEGGATGVCAADADVHPPKSSSAATDACRTGLLLEEIGSAHPPEMSLGVILDGTLPSSTLGGAGCAEAGSGAPHALISLPGPHGSNIAESLGGATGVLDGCDTGLDAGGGGCEVRLKGELDVLLLATGDVIFGAATGAGAGAGAGGGGEAGVELAKPPKSSAANRSAGIDVATGLDAGAGARGVAGCGGGAL